MSDKKTLTSFEAFWPFYLGEHSLPVTRWMHFVGTSIALLNLIWAVVYLAPTYVISALISGYFFAWVSHFFVEKEPPRDVHVPAVVVRRGLEDVGADGDRQAGRRADEAQHRAQVAGLGSGLERAVHLK